MYISKLERRYELMWFNSNVGEGLGIFRIFKSKLKSRDVRGYNEEGGNLDGRCSRHVWEGFIDFVVNGVKGWENQYVHSYLERECRLDW